MKQFAVKVCGITRTQDAAYAAELGVDMIGIIFHPASPRYLSLAKAKQIAKAIPVTIDKVGVFVNHTVSEILGIADELSLQYVQVHRLLNASEIKLLQNNRLKVIQSMFIANKTDITALYRLKAPDVVCLDNRNDKNPGGTGKQFDWSLWLSKKLPNLMLAGGINAKNVAEGVERFAPLIVDVNSGVEISPGIKSPTKLRLFMRECNRIRYGK